MKMFTAYESAGRLDDALDAIDDGRALDPRTARAFETSLNGVVAGPQKQRTAPSIDRRLDAETAHPGHEHPLRLARWLRLLPDESGRAEGRRLLEEALKSDPDNPRLHRELGAWWLGQWRDPAARHGALAELQRAARGPAGDAGAAIMLALLTGEGRHLNVPALQRGGGDSANADGPGCAGSEGSAMKTVLHSGGSPCDPGGAVAPSRRCPERRSAPSLPCRIKNCHDRHPHLRLVRRAGFFLGTLFGFGGRSIVARRRSGGLLPTDAQGGRSTSTSRPGP